MTGQRARRSRASAPDVWIRVAVVSEPVVGSLAGTRFEPVRRGDGGRAVLVSPEWRSVLLLLSDQADGQVAIWVKGPRKARRSEEEVLESVKTYLRLGLSNLRPLDPDHQGKELRRLLANALPHLTGELVAGSKPTPQLTAMRGPAISAGLPGLGRRRR